MLLNLLEKHLDLCLAALPVVATCSSSKDAVISFVICLGILRTAWSFWFVKVSDPKSFQRLQNICWFFPLHCSSGTHRSHVSPPTMFAIQWLGRLIFHVRLEKSSGAGGLNVHQPGKRD